MEVCPQSGQDKVREELGLEDIYLSLRVLDAEILTLGTSSIDRQYRRCADRAVAVSGQLYMVMLNHHPGLAYLRLCV